MVPSPLLVTNELSVKLLLNVMMACGEVNLCFWARTGHWKMIEYT